MQRQEYNINQRIRQLDILEALLRLRKHICDHREAEICAARMRGRNIGSESGSE
jgi:hypothetical protein